MSPPLLALFYARHGESRLAELEACAARIGAGDVQWTWDTARRRTHGGDWGPSLIQMLPDTVPSESLSAAAALSLACRGVFEVWGSGDTLAECADATTTVSRAAIRASIRGAWRAELRVLGARHSIHGPDPGVRMRPFRHVRDALHDRPVRLHGPADEIWLIEDRRTLEGGAPYPSTRPRFHLLRALPTTRTRTRTWLPALALRRRPFLGSSTMEPEQALLMCNLSIASASPIVPVIVDPFCGSGGILLAAAALGAQVVGSDNDRRCVTRSRSPLGIPASPHRPDRGQEAVCMLDNFEEAGLAPPLDLLDLDIRSPQAATRLLAANGGRPYDALVTDPPYGRRESPVAELLPRLLQLAGTIVRPGGRLVFLAPVRSPRAPHRPSMEALRVTLHHQSADCALRLLHLAEVRLHSGLHRATVVLERIPARR